MNDIRDLIRFLIATGHDHLALILTIATAVACLHLKFDLHVCLGN